MNPGAGDPEGPREPFAEVRRKAERMQRARRHRGSLFEHLAHVGVLGWLFALPVVGLTLAAHALGRALGKPFIALLGLLAGLVLGAYLVWRSLRRSLNASDGAARSERAQDQDDR